MLIRKNLFNRSELTILTSIKLLSAAFRFHIQFVDHSIFRSFFVFNILVEKATISACCSIIEEVTTSISQSLKKHDVHWLRELRSQHDVQRLRKLLLHTLQHRYAIAERVTISHDVQWQRKLFRWRNHFVEKVTASIYIAKRECYVFAEISMMFNDWESYCFMHYLAEEATTLTYIAEKTWYVFAKKARCAMNEEATSLKELQFHMICFAKKAHSWRS